MKLKFNYIVMNSKELKQLINDDQVGRPDASIKTRLDQAFTLRSATYPIRQNSFSGFISWIFSLKALGLKTALASLFIAFFLFNKDVTIAPSNPTTLDTTSVNQIIEIDSSLFQSSANIANDSVLL